MKAFLFAVGLCCAGLAQAQPDPCPALTAGAEAQVVRQRMAKDDLGAFRSIGERALQALAQCPRSDRLWYLAARSAEVLAAHQAGDAFAEHGGLKKIVSQALAAAPESAAVATIAARLDQGSALARKAHQLDSDYAPARRALAEALAREGAIEEALQLATPPAAAGPMHLTRSRVLLAAGRPAQALTQARLAGSGDPDEPTPTIDRHRDVQEALGLALLALKRPGEARKALAAAAASGSLAARQALARQRR